MARLAVEAGVRDTDEEFDAAGPDTLAFFGLVRAIGAAIGSSTPLVTAPPWLVLGAATIVGRARRDTMLSADELTGLMAGLLTSREPPRGRLRLGDWLEARGGELGRRYVSERVRNWPPIAPRSRRGPSICVAGEGPDRHVGGDRGGGGPDRSGPRSSLVVTYGASAPSSVRSACSSEKAWNVVPSASTTTAGSTAAPVFA